MAGTEPRDRRGSQRFVDADERDAVGALVAVIRTLRPHVVVTYDANGGYGHPDHIQAHRVTMAAVAAAGTDDYPGTPWSVPKLYWTVIARSAFTAGWESLGPGDLRADWVIPPADGDFAELGYPDDEIDAVIDAPEALAGQEGSAGRARYPAHRRTHRPGSRVVEQLGPAHRGPGALHSGRRRRRRT